MRSYVVKRLLHFRHSRRRRIDSASLLSRESTTLSLANPQKGHFMALVWVPAGRFHRHFRPATLRAAGQKKKSLSCLVPRIVTVEPGGDSPDAREAVTKRAPARRGLIYEGRIQKRKRV